MSGIAIIGLQWGDEGKGKISYLLSRDADYVVRFQGGANAGHTVVVGNKELKFNMIPAGAAAGAKPCIAAGTVVDLSEVVEEIEILKNIGVFKGLLISRNANVVLSIHKELDGIIEELRGSKAIGTTKRGIGPTYADKMLRIGIRMEDLLDKNQLISKIKLLEDYHKLKLDNIDEYIRVADSLKDYVCDLDIIINEELDKGKKIIFEGAQGSLLDIDHGTYPYVTSSNTTIGAIFTSCGIGPKKISEVVGVTKAYTTRVGAGVFPTELKNEKGEIIREKGKEYGTTTGRPRRVGWLDIPLLRYASKINDIDWIAMTKLDILSGFEKVNICVEYEIDEKRFKIVSPSVKTMERAKPIYIELDGWPDLEREEWKKIANKGFDGLPENAKTYIETVEKLVGKPIKIVSFGAEAGMEVIK
ncbi:MAG: adenylosuccinate synthase [Candidatus Aenigmarchaeota archaeon]|nr:adenylosuccinate synthase [Candidatus Aenigmarchaeota archaeon]